MELTFPGTSKLFEENGLPLDKFDEAFRNALKDAGEGYFILSGKEDAYLFIVSGRPYASGRIEKEGPASLEVRDFFNTFRKSGPGNLTFYKTDKKLLQSILVYFSKEPSQRFTSDMVDMEKVVSTLETEGSNCIITTRNGNKVAFSICLNGKISFNYLPDNVFADEQPKDALMLYIFDLKNTPPAIEIFTDIRLSPASDAISPGSEMPKNLMEHYSKGPAGVSVSGAEVILMLDNKVIGKFPITKAETTIGRNPGNDILIDNPGVSRRHAVIREMSGKFIVEDKGSANGTFIKGEKIAAREIGDGDQIQILKYNLQFKYKPEAPAEEETSAEKTMYIDTTAAKTKKEAKLILEDGKEISLKSAVLTMGSGDNMDIRLEGRLIGSHQASILMGREGKATLVHKGSFFTSTKVNGESIDQQLLKNDDIIEIGKYKIRYVIS